jgi:hypothetical protein
VAVFLIPSFGARFPYSDRVLEITGLPSWIWGFGNFDGVHYLKVAQDGYVSLSSPAFFPLYPLAIRFLTSINFLIPKNIFLDTAIYVDPAYFYNAMIISNFALLASLVYFYKLVRLDFSKKIAKKSVILLLLFPTSYYFGSIYNESLFILFVLASLYYLRTKRHILAGILAAFASATRVQGLLLSLVFIVEFINNIKSGKKRIEKQQLIKSVIGIIIAPLGLIAYMIHLKYNYQDPLYFLTVQPLFGAERSSHPFILLPQVIYRYFKIFLSVDMFSLLYLNAFIEFVFAMATIIILLVWIKKIRFSYWLFIFCALILPTLTGTFLSMPRFALMVVLIFPVLVKRYRKLYKWMVVVFVGLGVLLVSLFTRGYWVA